jgi:hypothetical protein
MKSKLLSFLLIAMMMQTSQAQLIDSLPFFKIEPGEELSIRGDLSKGDFMEDLSWAWNSSNACFPATQSKKFTGKHVLYSADLPSYSTMEVTVIPDDKKANFSIYAYEVGQVSEKNLVPNLPSCIRCEADHKWDYKYRGKTQDHTRTVKNLVAIRNPYQVVIGVTGADGLATGGYTLKIKVNKG